MNLPSISYYNGAALYADVSLQMSGNTGPWDSKANGGNAAALDATGAPTEAASAAFTSDYPSGDYVMSWDGTGTFTIAGATLGAVTRTMVNGTQHNVVTVTFKQTLSTTTSPAFTGVTATPPVTSFHLLAPASLTEATGTFLQDFATKMRPFTTVRFMDALNTNGNTVSNWSERTWPTEGSRGKPQGIAYEDIVAIANVLGLDVWINVPVLATDDYVCRMARLFKYGEQGDKNNGACDPAAAAGAATTAKLNPSSKVYVELSNEIWNAGFHQIHDVYCMVWGKTDNGSFPCDVTKPTSAIAAADLANGQISWSTDPGTKATQLAVFLARRDSTIFRTVFGCPLTSGTGCQAQIPYNVQSAYAAEVEPGFALLKKTDGSLAALDAMAVAPYFGIDDDSTATSVDAVFAGLDANLASKPVASAGGAIANWLAGDLAEASMYNLPLMAYEGGQGLSGGGKPAEPRCRGDRSPDVRPVPHLPFALGLDGGAQPPLQPLQLRQRGRAVRRMGRAHRAGRSRLAEVRRDALGDPRGRRRRPERGRRRRRLHHRQGELRQDGALLDSGRLRPRRHRGRQGPHRHERQHHRRAVQPVKGAA